MPTIEIRLGYGTILCRLSGTLSYMSFSGVNTIEVMAGFETRIIFGGESALLTPLDASDWDVIKAVTTPVIRAITKKCHRFYQSRILEESHP